MGSEGVIATITLKLFFNCIGGTLEEILNRNAFSHEVFTSFLYYF